MKMYDSYMILEQLQDEGPYFLDYRPKTFEEAMKIAQSIKDGFFGSSTMISIVSPTGQITVVGDKLPTVVLESKKWIRYVLRCKDGSLYCGITNDLLKRINKHTSGKGAKYTKSRGPFELLLVDEYDSKSSALRAELQFKKLNKAEKEKIMAQERSEYQKGIIKRYYDNKDNIDSQKLGEIVSELYLSTSEVNKKRLWKSAATSLLSLVGDKPAMKIRAEKIIADKDLTELAKIIGEIF